MPWFAVPRCFCLEENETVLAALFTMMDRGLRAGWASRKIALLPGMTQEERRANVFEMGPHNWRDSILCGPLIVGPGRIRSPGTTSAPDKRWKRQYEECGNSYGLKRWMRLIAWACPTICLARAVALLLCAMAITRFWAT